MNHKPRCIGIFASLMLILTGLAVTLLHAKSPPIVQASDAPREAAIALGQASDAVVTGLPAQTLDTIIEVEWSRVHSGTLDGIFYDDLYWGGISSSSPTLVDIDDDGDLDLFVYGGNRQQGNNNELHFFRNDGTATAPLWTHMTENYFGQYRQPVRFADLDGDGDLDAVLMAWSWESEGFIYYENTGSTSEPEWALRTTDMLGNGRAGEGDGGFTLVDIDGDGDIDLFFIITWEQDGNQFTSIAFYENTGSPSTPVWTFVTDTYADIIADGESWESFVSIAFADIDADGDLDLFMGETMRIRHFRNDGSSSVPVWTFVTDTYGGIQYGAGYMHFVIDFGDLDGNGTLDLVIGHTSGWLSSYRNTGTPANASWTLWVDGMLPIDYGGFANPALDDIDDDGDLDLFLGLGSPEVGDAHFVFLRNDGTRAAPAWTYITGDYGGVESNIGAKAPTFVDIDGDDDQDLFIGTGPFFGWQDGTVYFYENTGTPALAAFRLITDTYLGIIGSSSQVAPAFADIDGDGDQDLFVAISSWDNLGQVHFYRNDGDATSPAWTKITDNYMGIQAKYISFGDADGDGDLDMFTEGGFYRNDGDATHPDWALRWTPYGLAWSGGPPVLGDLLGGDGRLDLLLGGNGGLYLYHNVRGTEIALPVYDPDAIVIKTEPFATDAITQLQTGELDIYSAATADPDIAQQIADSPNLEGYISYGSYNELTFNPSGPVFAGTGKLNPFAVPRVREAMNRLVDREYIKQQIMGGMSAPRWHALNTVSRDYADLVNVARSLELEYAYDKVLAQQAIAEEMLVLGATLVDDIWYYGGEPVEIILLIRVEDHRRQIGDYVGDQLEDLGFTVIRDYKTSTEASNIWIGSDPADGLFHIYTGGWNSTEVERDLSGNFAFFYTNMGMGIPLWQAYVNTPEFYDVASRLRAHDFASLQERRAMMSQALDWALEDSVRIWLQDNVSITPRRAEVSYTSDLYGGIAGSWLWPHTLERTGSFTTPLSIGNPSILRQPWNPLNGDTWLYDMMLIRATSDNGLIPDPYTGLAWPQRIEEAEVVVQEGLPVFKTLDWVNLQFAPSIEVPGDAWVDWDATAQRFLTAAEVYTETQTALRKSVVYYPVDLYSTVTWHDGSHFSIADVVMNMILAFDRYKEASPVYDPTEMGRYNNFMATFKGVRIVSENPLIIEHYSDDYQLDAEKGITTWWPFYVKGPGAWHNLALGLLAEEAGTGAFSPGKANDTGVPQLDYVVWPGIALLEEQLAAAQAANVIPYAPTLGRYITPAEATVRWNNLANWHAAHGHFWIGTGPLYLEQVHPIFGELSLKYYPAYPDAPDRWADFAEPAIPEVSVTGPDGVVLGDEAIYNIAIAFNGQPYPNADIEGVYYLVVDSQNQLRFSGDAMPVNTTNGLWRVVLDANMTGQLSPGTNRLEVVVSSRQVAVPSFATHTFTDVEPCYVRVSSLPGITYKDLQTAVDAAQPGDTVKVAGTCTTVHGRPRHDLTTTGVVTQVAYIDKSLTLRGGYTTTNWLTSNSTANPTTLDASGQGRVIYISGSINPTIEGLRITGGDATGLNGGLDGLDGEWDAGGGVYVMTATATIKDNWIFGNTAGDDMSVGGGMHLESSNSTVTRNKISSNTAGFGGGVQAYSTSGTLSGNRVMSNTASGGGGGMCLWGGDSVTGNVVVGNTAGGNGGGMFLGSTGRNRLVNNVVVNNYAVGSGSGLYIDGSSQLWHTTVANNSGGDGSGIYVTVGLSPTSVVFTNTIVAQSSVGISVTGGNTITVNGILWHATSITVSQSSTATVEIQNQVTGDPRFQADGYHLRIGSLAIDAGVPTAVIRDVDGDPRPYGYGFDIGADETPFVQVPPETGATLVYTDTAGTETTLVVPPDVVSETTTIVLTELEPETLTAPPEFVAGGVALELDAYLGDELVSGFTFNEPVTLTLEYTDEDLAGMDESLLQLHRYVCPYPESLWLCFWEVIGTRSGEGQTLDMDNNVLTAWLMGFSRFGTLSVRSEPVFEISKTYTGSRVAGMPVTYTLTVDNTGDADATNVVLEDSVPEYLTWTGGGTLVLNRVRWTFEAITVSGGTAAGQFSAALPCTASLAIVNDDYQVVSSAQGVTSTVGPLVSFTVIPPTLTVGIDYTPSAPVAGDTVYFTATAATNGTPLSYAWSFGGTGLHAARTYATVGAYTVTLTARDSCGYEGVATVSFDVKPVGYKLYLPLVMRE